MQQIKVKPITQSFILDTLPPTMNEIIAMAKPFKNSKKKCSKYDLAKIEWNVLIDAIVRTKKLKPFTTPVWVHIRFFNEKIDRDNLRACQKFILDGMVESEFIVEDSQKWVEDITYKEEKHLDGVAVIVTVSDKPIYKQVAIEY